MFNQEEEKEIPHLECGVNIIRKEDKFYQLPLLTTRNCFLQDGTIVELILLDESCLSVQSFERPIRYGKYYGSRLFFNAMTDRFNINPKFFYDGKKGEWVLMNAGYVCFAELEIEHKNNHKLYGGLDA